MKFHFLVYLGVRGVFLFFLCLTSFFVGAQNDFEFVPNEGQFHENVLYRANIPSGALFLEENGLTFSFYDGAFFHNIHHGEQVEKLNFHAYKIHFQDCNVPETTLTKYNSGVINYYLGNDPSKWAQGVKGGKEVYYQNIYDNIDFRIYTKDETIKYDFIVHPGGTVSDIKLKFEGLDRLFTKGSELFMQTSLGTVIDSKPIAIQNRDSIKLSYQLNKTTVRFEVGKYDIKEDLIIDPTLVFSTYSGSLANNFGFTATYDEQGNLYAGGSVFDQGYPITLGAFDITFNSSSTLECDLGSCWGISDIGITKYSADGKSRLYSTYLGGNRCEVPHSLIVNNRNELFVLGTTSSDNYPVTNNAFDQTFNGGNTANLANGIYVNYTHGSDIVVSRLSSDGSAMLASTYVGGTQNDGLNLNGDLVANYADQMRGEIILDDFQNVVIGSSTASEDFPVTSGALQTVYGGGEQDGIVFKMDENLSRMIWSSYFGGNDADGIYSIIQSNSNDVYAAGGTKSDNITFPSNAFQSGYQGGVTDGFYAKLSNGGDDVLQGSYLGSDQYDQVYFIREDSRNSIYFYGQSNKFGSYWITNAGYNTPNSGQFILKLDSLQNNIEWSTTFGSGDNKINISPTAFMVDLCDKIYLSGWGSGSSGFDGIGGNIADGTIGMEVTPDAFKSSTLGHDFYLMVLESDASNLIYGSFYGGDESSEHVDGGTSRFDKKGVMYQSVCAGCGGNSDFPIEPFDAVSPNNNSNCNNGVFKFDFGLPNVVADFETPPVSCSPATILFVNKSKFLDATSFLWDFGDGTFSTDTNPSHFYSSPGNYEVVLTITDSTACNFADSIVKNIILMGVELENELNDFSCDSFNMQIGIPPYPDTSVTYAWVPSFGLSDTSISNPIANLDSNQQYRLIISGNACSDTIYQNIIISQFDLKAFGDTSLCNPFAGIPIYNETSPGLVHHWSSNSSFSDTLLYGVDSNEVNLESVSGENYFYIKVEDSVGCNIVDSVHVIVYDYDISYQTNLETCLNDSIEVFPVGYENYDSVYFSWGPSPLLTTSVNDTNAVFHGFVPGVYSVPVTSTSAYSCTDTDYVSITVASFDTSLAISLTTNFDTLINNQTAILTAVPEGLNYAWSPIESILNAFENNAEVGIEESTLFTVEINDPIVGNCFRRDSVFIVFIDSDCEDPYVYVPNAFSPNGDGDNDVLYVRGRNITDVYFAIFNRWGEKVFETNDQSKGWDGFFRNRNSDPAVFDYYLQYLCEGGIKYFQKGNITLIR